jgi:quercetin dioxygenase-like cupin family protein
MEFDRFVSKGWGFERWVVNGPLYCGKLLFVAKGRRCSWHFHKLKDETFHVLGGHIGLSFVDADFHRRWAEKGYDVAFELKGGNYQHVTLRQGDTFHVPVGMLHQFQAVVDSTILEVSTEHKDEDSYRIIKGD